MSTPAQLRAILARAIPNGTTVETHSPVHTIHCLEVHLQAIEAAAAQIEQLTCSLTEEREARLAAQAASLHEADLAQQAMDELQRIHSLAGIKSVDSWLHLPPEQLREWFAVTTQRDTDHIMRIRDLEDERAQRVQHLPADDTEGGDPS